MTTTSIMIMARMGMDTGRHTTGSPIGGLSAGKG
jgi:hypothetical protein